MGDSAPSFIPSRLSVFSDEELQVLHQWHGSFAGRAGLPPALNDVGRKLSREIALERLYRREQMCGQGPDRATFSYAKHNQDRNQDFNARP